MFRRRKEQSNEQPIPTHAPPQPTSPTSADHKEQSSARRRDRGTSPRAVNRGTSPRAVDREPPAVVRRRNDLAVSTIPEITWNEAHRRTCLQRKSLAVSFHQVTETFNSFGQLPQNRDDVVTWTESSSLEAAVAVCGKLRDAPGGSPISKPDTSADRPSSWAKRLWKGAAKGASTLILGSDDYDDNIPELGADDGEESNGKQEAVVDDFIVDSDQLIVNVDLAQSCLKELEIALRNQPTRVLVRKSAESHMQAAVAEWFSFETWCRQVAIQCDENKDAKTLLANLDPSMCDFLGDLLVANNLATFAPDRQDRIILGSTNDMSPAEIDTMVNLFDLQINEEIMNKNIEAWSARADVCGRNALEAGKKGRKRQAAIELKQRQMLQQQIATTQASLLQLEQIRNTLEHAQTQSQVMECLHSTAEALRAIRTDPTALQSLRSEINNTRTALEEAQIAHHSSLATSDEDNKLMLQGLEDTEISKDEEEQLLLELDELEMSPAKAKRNVTNLVSVTTGIATPKSHTTIARTSPTKSDRGRRKKSNDGEDDDADVRDLERRLIALRTPASNNTKSSNQKGPPDKTLAAVAF